MILILRVLFEEVEEGKQRSRVRMGNKGGGRGGGEEGTQEAKPNTISRPNEIQSEGVAVIINRVARLIVF